MVCLWIRVGLSSDHVNFKQVWYSKIIIPSLIQKIHFSLWWLESFQCPLISQEVTVWFKLEQLNYLAPGHSLLPGLMSKHGLNPHLVGTWGLGPSLTPTQVGFESFSGYLEGGADKFQHKLGNKNDFYYNRNEDTTGCEHIRTTFF